MTSISNTDQRVGVVAIGRNEGERLRRCLESAMVRGGPVVYVDSGSMDDSVGIARELGADVVQLDLLRPFTAARVRNEGIARLRALDPAIQFVQVVDGDCELAGGWIEAALAEMERSKRAAVVCGRRWERYPRLSRYNKLCDMEWDRPCGDVEACGGDALIRLSAYEQVGGYNESLIAGEEPEWCVRLRGAGWIVRRIDHDMTLHDAHITRFGQWCRRAMRCGHAYAEGRRLHGRSAVRYRVREVRSILFWALLLPLAALGAAWFTRGAGLALLGAYFVLYLRVKHARRRQGDSPADAALFARFCVAGKFLQLLGVLQFRVNVLMGRPSSIIEYKGDGTAPAAARPAKAPVKARRRRGGAAGGRILYVGGSLPSRSETFVYREVLALRQRGLDVVVASIHPPHRHLGDKRLDALADEAVCVYGSGTRRLLMDALRAVLRRPARGAMVLARGVRDALLGRDVRLARRPRVLWQVLAGLALAQRVRGLDVAHVHSHMAHVQTTIAMYAAAWLGVPFSFTGHAVDLFSQRTLLRQKLRRAAFAVCISYWHRAFYERLVPRAHEDLPIVRCGVDVKEFAVVDRGGHSGCRIVSVGRLVRKKGFDVLIEAIAALAREGLNVPCRIIGDGPEMTALRRLRIELNVSHLVELVGPMSNEEVRGELAGADLFVLPCRVDESGDRDGIPVVLIEAMATGLCPVAGDLVTVRELIKHDRSGLLVKPGCPDGLSSAIASLAGDGERRQRLGLGGRAAVEEEFALDMNADRLRDIYAAALGLSAAQPAHAGRGGAAAHKDRRRAA